jgi:polygalacturonase
MNQSPLLPPRSWSFIGFAVGFLLSAFSASANPTASSVWLDFAANPHNHQNIPNNAYAGYRGGKMPIPDVPVVVNLLDFGGNGNGLADNTQAFQNAIEAAWIAGGGAVYVPPGVYVVDKMIHLNQSGVVLRGAGSKVSSFGA